MSQEQADIPFREVVELCQRHGFKLMRIVDGVRVFWKPGCMAPSDPLTWVAVEVESNRCVSPTVYSRLRQFFREQID